jgi:UDP-glucose 4-epimerase
LKKRVGSDKRDVVLKFLYIRQKEENMSNLLVTGGAGFIGPNLTEALLRMGHRVRVLDNFSAGKRENLIFNEAYPLLEIIEGDMGTETEKL